MEGGMVVNLMWEKPLRDGGLDTFELAPCKENKQVCLIQLLDGYVACVICQGRSVRHSLYADGVSINVHA